MQKKTRIIAIAGRSCSGKSTLAWELCKILQKKATHVNTDYSLLNSANLNCEKPTEEDRLIMNDFHKELLKLKSGKEANFPVYDFQNKHRSEEKYKVQPAEIIIIEGCLVLWDEKIRNISDIKVFIDVSDKICFQRRIGRGLKSREIGTKNYKESKKKTNERWKIISQQWDNYLEPTSKHADIIVKDSDSGLEQVLSVLYNVYDINDFPDK